MADEPPKLLYRACQQCGLGFSAYMVDVIGEGLCPLCRIPDAVPIPYRQAIFRIRIERALSKESWTAMFVGDVLFVEHSKPTVRTVTLASGRVETLAGFDVRMDMLTVDQWSKVWWLTGGRAKELFAPAECVRFLGDVG